MKTLLAIMALLAGFTASAAEEATTKAKKEEIMKEQRENAPVQEDIDSEITNAKMRADSGSKSKHSLSAGLGYSGGTLEDVFGKKRPKLSPSAGTPDYTSLSGSINYRYRLSQQESLTAGVAVGWVAPGHDLNSQEDKENGVEKTQLTDPGLAYSRSFKAGQVQNSTSLSFTKNTDKQVVESEKTNFGLGVSHTAIIDVGPAGLQLGLSADAGYTNYSSYVPGEDKKTGAAAATPEIEYEVGLFPFVEYAFNDRYNFRTVFRGTSFYSRRDNHDTFTRSPGTQSMGIGIAATRDIFLYPNIQWVWEDTRSEKTNVALSASMNFF